MKTKRLIELLSMIDPESEVLQEFEGNVFSLDEDDVRVGKVDLIRLSPANEIRPEPHDIWSVHGYHDDDPRLVVTSPAVVVGVGQSESDWPERIAK